MISKKVFMPVAVLALVLPKSLLAAEPEPIAIAEWITAADNLTEAARFELDGTVTVELDVDREGAVSNCRITTSSGHDLLDEHTCSLLRSRARFRPARDAAGRRVAATFSHSATWQVITNANWAEDGWVKAEGMFDPAGAQASTCEASTGGRISDHMKELACFILVNQAGNIASTMPQRPDEPIKIAMVLAISSNEADIRSSVAPQDGWKRVSYTDALVIVGPAGLRSDCRMIETRGPAAMIFPSCTAQPAFRYVAGKNAAGESVTTELRQVFAYFVEARPSD